MESTKGAHQLNAALVPEHGFYTLHIVNGILCSPTTIEMFTFGELSLENITNF